MISVIIPTYDSVETLDLCLRSAIEGQTFQNQIIVVVDGKPEVNREVLSKYHDHINILNLEENVGLPRATNLGVMSAQRDWVLVVNDDNVFQPEWDARLMVGVKDKTVITPNQVEPYPSIFKQFVHKDFGTTAEDFQYSSWCAWTTGGYEDKVDDTGSTLPFFMKRKDFLTIGGWDDQYPTNGIVADWDFFLKCQLAGFTMERTYRCHFYHFVSNTVNSQARIATEREGHNYARWKWNDSIKHNPTTNLKYL